MLMDHRSYSAFEVTLISLLLYYINWVASSKVPFSLSEKYKSTRTPLQLEKITHTLSRNISNETADKGQSNFFKSQQHFEVWQKSLVMKAKPDYRKLEGTSARIDPRILPNILCNSKSTSCSTLAIKKTRKHHHDQKERNERFQTTKLFPSTPIPYPYFASPMSQRNKKGDLTAKCHKHIKRKGKAYFLENTTTTSNPFTLLQSWNKTGNLHSSLSIAYEPQLLSPSSSSSLKTQKSSLMQLDASPLSLSSVVSTGQQIEGNSQVGKSLKSDVSLMKSEIKSSILKVREEEESATVGAVQKHPTPGSSLLHVDLFLASKSEHHRLYNNAQLHFKRSSSSQKSIGNIIKADKHSGETRVFRRAEPTAGKYSYLSKRNEDKKGKRKVKNGDSVSTASSILTYYSRDVNKSSSIKPALTNVELTEAMGKCNKLFTVTSSGSRSNNVKGTTQLMARISKGRNGEKVGERGNQNFTANVDLAIEKQKQNLDRYPRFLSSSHSNGDKQTKPSLNFSDASHKRSSGTSKSRSKSSNTNGKTNVMHVTSVSSIHHNNLNRRKVTQGVVSLPTTPTTPTTSEAAAIGEIMMNEVVFRRPKVEKNTGGLETISGARTNNIHLKPGTRTRTESSSTTRNCSSSSSTASSKTVSSVDGKGTSRMTRLQQERNKSHVENVNDSLTSCSCRCKSKRETKQGFHFTFLRNGREKLTFNLLNENISFSYGNDDDDDVTTTGNRKSIETSGSSSITTTTASTIEKNQLAKLDDLTRATSFELQQTFVDTKGKPISGFDDSPGTSAQTVAATQGKSELQNGPCHEHHYAHSFGLSNKPTKSSAHKVVDADVAIKKHDHDFPRIKEHKRLRRNVMKEDHLFKNVIRHQTVLLREREIMLSAVHPPIIIPTKISKLNNIEQRETQAPGTVASNYDSPASRVLHDIDLLVMNKARSFTPNKFENAEKQVPTGILFQPNELSIGASNNNSAYYNGNDAYSRLQLETKSSRSSQLSLTAQQQQQEQNLQENGFKFMEEKSNNGERDELPTNSSPMTVPSIVPLTRERKISLISSLPLSSAIKVSSLKPDGTKARSSSRKWDFAHEKRTAQGDGILDANRKFSSRSFSVNREEENRDSEMQSGRTRELLELTHEYDGGSSDPGRGINMRSSIGESLIDPLRSIQRETESIPRLSQVQEREKSSLALNNGEVQRVEATPGYSFISDDRGKLRKKQKRDTGCSTTTNTHPTNTTAMVNDECGKRETGVMLEKRNSSRKLIRLKGNMLALNFTLTQYEKPLSAGMNTNKSNVSANNDDNRYDAIKLNDTIHHQVVKKVEQHPTRSPSSNAEAPFYIWKNFSSSRNRNIMTQKIANEGEKVLHGNYNFIEQEWMNVKVNSSRNNTKPSKDNTKTKHEHVPNSLVNILSIINAAMPSELHHSIFQKASDYHATSAPQHQEDSNALGQMGNMLSPTPMQNPRENYSMSEKEPEMFTVVSSSSLNLHSTEKPEENNGRSSPADSPFTTSIPSSSYLNSNESSTSPASTKAIGSSDESLRNEETPTATAPSTNYDFDRSTLTLLTSTTKVPILLPSSSASSSVTVTQESPTTEISENSSKFIPNFPTTNAPTSLYSEAVNATNGFTLPEKILPSTRNPHDEASSTLLIDESKPEEGELATTSSVGTSLHNSLFTDVSDTATTTAATKLSSDLVTITSDLNKQSNTPPVSDETTFQVTVIASVVSTESNQDVATTTTTSSVQSESDVSPAKLPSEATTISAPTSHKDFSPTEIPSIEVQDASETSQPQGTTLMSTPTTNLEDKIMSPMTSTMSSTFPSTISSDIGESNNININEGMPTGTSMTVTTTTHVSLPAGGEEDLKATESPSTSTVAPPECDHKKGMEYSQDTKTCVCKPGLQYEHNEDKCVSLVGNECFGDSETSNGDCPLNSHCKPQDVSGVQKRCACLPGYIPVADKTRCMAGWKTDCSSTTLSDINIKNHCHPDFDCVSKPEEAGSECVCKHNRTIGLPHSLEVNISSRSSEWRNGQQIACFLDYGSHCDPLNDECNDFRFLKCSRQNAKCECSDSNNQLYDERTRECVARAGTYCTLSPNDDHDGAGANSRHEMTANLRHLACIGNSTCARIGNETSSNFSGTCKCEEGYDQHWQGYCLMKGSGSLKSNHKILEILCLIGTILINNCVFKIFF